MAGKLVPDLILFFKKLKPNGLQPGFTMFSPNYHTIKTNCIILSDYWSRDKLNFDFLEKSLGIVSLTYFEYDFPTKMFLMLYSINWPNFIVWLSLLLAILGSVYCNCLLTRLGCQKFWNWLDLSNQVVFIHEQKVRTKT